MVSVPVVILAGGRGARFDHETEVLPKPLIEVAGKPILGHIMDLFEAQGFHEFWILGGYMWEKIEGYLKTRYECSDTPPNYPEIRVFGAAGARLSDGHSAHLFDTGEDASTGDRLEYLSSQLMLTRPVILTYGDGLADVDLNALLSHHREMRKRVHPQRPMVTVTAVQPPGRFGVLRFDDMAYHVEDQDFVIGFEEKSVRDWINGGFMVVDNGVVPMFVPRKPFDDGPYESFESGALPRLAAKHSLAAYKHHGYWRCMDTRRDREQIEADVAAVGGRLPWRRDMMEGQ